MLDSKHPSPAEYPVSLTNAAYSPRVTSYLPMANDPNVTRCCGASSETDSGDAPCFVAQAFSDSGEPMMNEPAGITIISGQSWQSRNTVSGFAAVRAFACCSSACAAVTAKMQADSNKAASNVRFRVGFICQLLMRCTRVTIVPNWWKIF